MKISDEAKRASKRAAQFGVALAILCQLLPHDYRVICEAVAQVCRGGL